MIASAEWLPVCLDCFLTGMEAFASLLLFEAFLPRKNIGWRFRLGLGLYIIADVIVIVGIFPGSEYQMLRVVLGVLLCTFLLGSLFRNSFWLKLVLAVLWNALIWTVDLIGIALLAWVRSESVDAILANPMMAMTAGPASKLILVLCCAMIKEMRRQAMLAQVRWTQLVLLCLFPLASIYMMILMMELGPEHQQQVMFSCILLLAATLAMLFVLDLLERQAQDHEENTLLRQQLNMELEQAAALDQAYAQQRAAAHDYNRHLNLLQELLTTHQEEEALRYLEQLQKNHSPRLMAVRTGHSILDALLNQKVTAARAKHIDLEITVNDLSGVRVNNEFLVVLLSNLIDNAIEACCKLDGEREIQLMLLLEDERLFCSVRNPSLPVDLRNGLPATTKQGANHGYGLKNVARILALYHTKPAITYENGWFQVAWDLPNTPIS